MASKAAAPTTRDRPGTEQAILDAAKQVLAQDGFSAFGVNAIARQAGCDKQLIYRYYGGLDGLVDAIGGDLADLFRLSMTEPEPAACESYAAFIEHLLLSLLDAFRSSDLLMRIAAWEVADSSPVTRRLADARGKALGAWIESRRGNLHMPEDADTGAINATLIAAVQHLCLSAHAVGGFGGMSLKTEKDWARVREVLRAFVRASYVKAI